MTIQSQIYSDISKQNIVRDKANRSKQNSQHHSTTNDFAYSSNKKIVTKVEMSIISRLERENPTSAKKLKMVLAKDNPYQKYIRLLQSLGLDAEHNYADVFTGYMLGMWRIANRKMNRPTAEQIQSVRKQVIENIDISGLNDRDRQEKAAFLIYDLIFANEPYEASCSENNSRQINMDSDMVQNRFLRQNKLDLRKLVITESGLIAKN